MSPHLLPTDADLDDPLGFREGAEAPAELSADAFDAELRNLLERGPSSGSADEQSTDEE
jgi:hypothetical protein